MKRTSLTSRARACTLLAAALLASAAIAETDTTATPTQKDLLDIERLKWSLEKDRADYYKSLVPDLSAYKREAPSSVPQVAATTTRVAYQQAQALAASVAQQIQVELKKPTDPPSNTSPDRLLLDSPHLLGYQSSFSSVQSLLKTNFESVDKLNENLKEALRAKEPEPAKKNDRSKGGDAGDSKAAGIAAAIPLLQLGLSVATALRTSYVMGGTTHESLSTKVLQAQVVSNLADKSIKVYDADAAISWPKNGDAKLTTAISDLQTLVAKARASLFDADKRVKALTVKAKSPDPKGDPDPELTAFAEGIAAHAKLLAADTDAAAKYLVSLYTPTDTGLTPLIAAKRGLWLNDQLEKNPNAPRLTVASAVAATDIIAADGWLRGLRVAVAGNTIVEWKLVFPDGRVATGTAQSCSTPKDPTCGHVVLRPDEPLKQQQ